MGPQPLRAEAVTGKDFWAHLEDLRGIIIKSMIAVVCSTTVCFLFIPKIFLFLLLPYQRLMDAQAGQEMIKAIDPSEAFLISFKLALIGGIVLALPVILYQTWSFVVPGLIERERRYLNFLLCSGSLLFLVGAVFAYTIVFPLAVQFLWDYTIKMGVVPDWTISYYINFVMAFLLAFGIAFEFPIVVFLLVKLGLVRVETLRAKRRHAIVIIFIVAALLSPPDVISQILLGVPMVGLYELTIWLTHFLKKK